MHADTTRRTIVQWDPIGIVLCPGRCAHVLRRPVSHLYGCMTPPRSIATPPHRLPTEENPRALLVSVRQILSLSRSSIYLLIEAGKLTPIRIGRSVRFSVGQLEGFVEDLIAERDGVSR